MIASDCPACGGHGTVGCDGECNACSPGVGPWCAVVPTTPTAKEVAEVIHEIPLTMEYGGIYHTEMDLATKIAEEIVKRFVVIKIR